jgi:hypothetical protein
VGKPTVVNCAEKLANTVVDGVAVKVVENFTGTGPEATDRYPEPPAVLAGVAGSKSSTCEETVNPPAPAVVVQTNSVAVVTLLAPVPDAVPE